MLKTYIAKIGIKKHKIELELGDSVVRAILYSLQASVYQIVREINVPYPNSEFDIQHENLSNVIQHAYQELQTLCNEITLLIPDRWCMDKQAQVPRELTAEQIYQELPFEIDGYFSSPIEELYYDFQILNLEHADEKLREIKIIAVDKKLIDRILDAANNVGLKVNAVKIRPYLDINLLPWREQQLWERKRNFLIMCIVATVIAFILIASYHFILKEKLNQQNQHNQVLLQEMTVLDTQCEQVQKIKQLKQKTIQDIQLMAKLKNNCHKLSNLFSQLAKITPNAISLISLKYINHQVLITANATSNKDISLFVHNINAAPGFVNATLTENKNEQDKGSQFSLVFDLIDQ